MVSAPQKPFRAFVNRDYSKGVEPRFEAEPLPVKLEGLVCRQLYCSSNLDLCTVVLQERASHPPVPHVPSPSPPSLQLTPEQLKETITKINSFFEEAEAHTSSLYWRNFANCLVGYVADFCLANPYDKHMKEMSAYVQEQNKLVYNPRGLVLIDPLDRGLRVIEITNLPGKAVVLEKTSL